MNEYKTIVNKSTVPVGTANLVYVSIKEILSERMVDVEFSVVSNPEFLKEGAAIDDFMRPDRIVLGVDDEKSNRIMNELYAPFNLLTQKKVITMDIKSAEMTKYAANAMLATKISFINEIASLCDKYGADVNQVRNGIGSDSRIGYKFTYPGVGYGGSCFPKDVKALIQMAKKSGIEPVLLSAVEARNDSQKKVLVEKVLKRFNNRLNGILIAVWGLSFKPQTDDMREAPSVVIINELIENGAKIIAYDPVAIDSAKQLFKGHPSIRFADSKYFACNNADALLLITEWHQFRSPDFNKLKTLMKSPIIFDGRNQYDPKLLRKIGFEYYCIGRP
jgi:UDPglucose 6-dehydrogenase